MKLNLGCGPDIREGWLNADIRRVKNVDVVHDARSLPYPDESMDYILASDLIEHFPKKETESLLQEWKRVLKKGGGLEIRTPDLNYLAQEYIKRKDGVFASYHLFGAQDYPYNFHYVVFDIKSLTALCEHMGFQNISSTQERTNFRLKMEKH